MFSLLLFYVGVVSTQLPRLPKLNIDPAAVSISGISSGADFVAQYAVAYSKTTAGFAVFAGKTERHFLLSVPFHSFVCSNWPSTITTSSKGYRPLSVS